MDQEAGLTLDRHCIHVIEYAAAETFR